MPLARGSLVGRVFDPTKLTELPTWVTRLPEEQRIKWCTEETERWKIVDKCSFCERDLIAGEKIPHRMSHADAKVASAVMTVLQRGPEVARASLDLLKELLEG